jgi:hypothetical protein
MMQPDASRHSGEIWDTAALSPQAPWVDSSGVGRLLGATAHVRLRLGAGQAECLAADDGDHCPRVWAFGVAVAFPSVGHN